ncbi:NADH-quinone oxidoreductase subunit N [Labeo rohita]|uniref:NADH-quinone oxidoreductase subunit N n=1 Tax=Labeo rohita TaxID=84645 RepID=A0ABQ8LHG6_LABRO|nr:NADH-quinone oxidoreductase subunit N [Labeo rohita]
MLMQKHIFTSGVVMLSCCPSCSKGWKGKSVGKHDLVIRFPGGTRRLNPPQPPSVPSWDLSLVLRALQQGPFEPLQSVKLKFISVKTLVILRPRPGYMPTDPTNLFRDQVVSLKAPPLEEADPALALLCPVRALRWYVDRTQSFRTSDQPFICYGGRQGNSMNLMNL